MRPYRANAFSTQKVKPLDIVRIAAASFLLVLLPSIGMGSLFNCDLDRADSTAVVTPEKRIESVDLFETLLDDAIWQIQKDDRYDNFILFVHGNGQHPCHAFDKSLIADMQVDYSAKVIMYHWPSWEGPIGFPVEKAKKSAKDFKKVLCCLQAYRQRHKDQIKDINFTLLTHSMGSIVLEGLILDQNGASLTEMFDTIIINASCSAGKTHAQWVEKIRMSENIFITVNQNDPTLGKAELHEEWRYGGHGFSRLGKRLTGKNGLASPLAQNATYIDVTRAPLRHVYYLHRYLQDCSAVKYFFDMALNGIPPDLDKAHGVEKIERERIYILEKNLPASKQLADKRGFHAADVLQKGLLAAILLVFFALVPIMFIKIKKNRR